MKRRLMRKRLTGNRTRVKRKQTPHQTRLKKTQKKNHPTKTRKIYHWQNASQSTNRGTQNQSHQTPSRPKWKRKSLQISRPKRWRAIRTLGEWMEHNWRLLMSRWMQKSRTPAVIQTLASKFKTVRVENFMHTKTSFVSMATIYPFCVHSL